MEVIMMSRGVEISIAGGVEETQYVFHSNLYSPYMCCE